ncbi:armadillo-type protein [Mycena rebaudengoi]|nr:armadillo-type protein [Mycena rebaudengoi]
MPPLTRQDTLESLRSWWSDSNPNLRGPTINLHAAAKPFMRLLYDRQALEFIGKIDGISLSAMNAEIYGSYLSCEYVSASTKSAILEDLFRRAYSDPEALEIHAHLFHDFVQLLEGPVPMDARMLVALRRILLALAGCEATAKATCGSLVDLLCNTHMPQIVGRVLSLLSSVDRIKFPPVTSGASVEAKLLGCLLNMLEDSSTAGSRLLHILGIISNLAFQEATAVAIVEANILNSVKKLLNSRSINLRREISLILENLMSHETSAMAVLRMLSREDLVIAKLLHAPTIKIICGSLVALACDSDMPDDVFDGALWLLSRVPEIKFSPATSGASLEAKLLDRLSYMLKDSSTPEGHNPPIFQIVSILARHEAIAVAIVDANILHSVEKLLRSCPTSLYNHIFSMLEHLVSHESTAMAVVRILPLDLLGTLWRKSVDDTAPVDVLATLWEDLVTTKLLDSPRNTIAEATCGSLVTLMCDSDMPQVVEGALWVLSRIPHLKFLLVMTGLSVETKLLDHIADMLKAPNTPKWRYPAIFQILSHLELYDREPSAIAAMEENIINSIENLLRSLNTDLRRPIFSILESLASYEPTAMGVVRMIPFDLLGALWHKSVDDTAPVDVLATLWEDLVTAKLLDSSHKAIAEATCGLLVALVCHSDMPQSADGALWVLSRVPQIQFPPVTTGTSVEAKLLDHIVTVLKAPNTAEWRYPVIFQILFHLALHSEFIAPREAAAEATCGSLVALVCDSDMPDVVDGALWLLSRIPYLKFPPFTSGLSVEAKLLNHIKNMLDSPNTDEWRYMVIFEILSHLARYESSAVAVVEVNVLNSVEKLLRSRPTDLYERIFRMLENLVSYKSTAMAVVRMIPFNLLGALWRKSVDDTAPVDVLATLWEDLVTTKLLDSPHKAIADATWSSLVAFVCDSDMPEVVDGALWVLSRVPRLKFPPVTTGLSVEPKLLDYIVYLGTMGTDG